MISYHTSDLFRSTAEVWVNPVNLMGVSGAGLALKFKQRFPYNFQAYQHACAAGMLQTGTVLVFPTSLPSYPKYIVNFPSKRHWKQRSRFEDVELSTQHLVKEVQKLRVESLAMPAVGCGLGGLNWGTVQPMLEKHLGVLQDMSVEIYLPK